MEKCGLNEKTALVPTIIKKFNKPLIELMFDNYDS